MNSIQNVVLIDHLTIDFSAGLCALTGETGAGKSILLDSMGLALGARSDAGLVRKGTDQASVTAVFELPAGPHPAKTLLEEAGKTKTTLSLNGISLPTPSFLLMTPKERVLAILYSSKELSI